jgi:apolipoprotein N-acyltransferase
MPRPGRAVARAGGATPREPNSVPQAGAADQAGGSAVGAAADLRAPEPAPAAAPQPGAQTRPAPAASGPTAEANSPRDPSPALLPGQASPATRTSPAADAASPREPSPALLPGQASPAARTSPAADAASPREPSPALLPGQASPAARTSPAADAASPRQTAAPSGLADAAPASADVRPDARGGLRLLPAMLLAIAGGLALAAAFPPVGFWPLAAVGPGLLVVSLWRRSLRGSFAVGLGFGLAFFVPLLSWLINVAWYAWGALAVAEAVIFALFAIGQRLMLRLRAWPVAVACWWVAVEAFRDRWPYAFPWGRLSMSQAQAPTVRWVAYGGPPLLTFLVALAGTTLAWLLLAPRQAPRSVASRAVPAAVGRRVVPGLALAAAAGLALAGAALPAGQWGPGSPTAEVAAVQGNVPRAGTFAKQAQEATVTGNHAAATKQLAAQVRAGSRAAPDLVIWPENSTDIDPSLDPVTYATIAGAVSAIGRPVLVGAVLDNPRRNTGELWLPGRGPVAIYAKRQLVPFGEYIPFRGIISSFSSLPSLQPVDFTPGHRAVVFRVGKIRLGDVICYEVGFDNLVSSEVTAGANLLTEQTNDADFELDGQLGETLQQLAMARIRAIEFDRAMIVSGTTGVSAIIAPDGSLIVHTRTWQRAVLEARVPLLSGSTLAERVGEVPEIVFSALALAALAWAVAAAARQRRT